MEHLFISDNPVCTNSSAGMLRIFLIASMPKLITFNGENVNELERREAEAKYAPVLKLHYCAAQNLTTGVSVTSSASSNSGLHNSPSKSQNLRIHQQQQLLYLKRNTIAGSMLSGSDDSFSALGAKLGAGAGAFDLLEGDEIGGSSGADVAIEEYEIRRRGVAQTAPGNTITVQLSKRAMKQSKSNAEFNRVFEEAVKYLVNEMIVSIRTK